MRGPGRPRRQAGRGPCGRQRRPSDAETGEPRTGGRGGQEDAACTGNRARPGRLGPTRPTSRQGIAQQAARPPGSRFRTRSGRLDEDVLQQGWRDIRQDAAAGVDQVRAPADAQHLDETLHRLVERLKQQRYRATLVRRPYLPTGDGPPRPLGSPAVEDTLLPLAVARLLEASDAQDVRRGSDGSRPPVGALEAVDTRPITRHVGRDAGVVDAASNKFCAPIAPAGMVRRVAARLEDGARRRWIRTWLKAGGRDTDGPGRPPGPGTPPGGTGAPLLAHVVRHDARDRWCEDVVNQPCRGDACLLRDADACGCACEDPADAARVANVRGQRLETCGRELSGAKTRIIPCRRHRPAGKTRGACLGCACRWGQARQGREHLTRRTARQKRRAALTRVTAWGQEPRHLRRPVLVQRLNAKRRG